MTDSIINPKFRGTTDFGPASKTDGKTDAVETRKTDRELDAAETRKTDGRIAIDVYDDRRERKRHGSYEFPVAVYHYIMRECTLGYINWHWHEEIQLTLVTHGAIRFFADGQQYVVPEGGGFFIGSGRLHMARPESDPDSSYLCLDFHPRMLAGFPGSAIEEKYVKPYIESFSHLALGVSSTRHRAILQEVQDIAAVCEKREFGFELDTAAHLARLWLRLISISGNGNRPEQRFSREHDTVQAVIGYLAAHYQERVTLDDVARAVGFSASECCRMFKRVTGGTILSYLRVLRLDKALELLAKSDLSVSQIAYETGFSGASYFIESFKKELHETPLQYRRQIGRVHTEA